MMNKPFTLNKKRLTLMTASAAMVLAAPGDDPIDDSGEVIVPFDPEDPTADLPDPSEPVVDPEPEPEPETPDEPVEGEPEPDEPVVEPEPDTESPGELDPVVDPEPEEDTGTEPEPSPIPEVEPEPEIEPEVPVVDNGDLNADAPVRVLVKYVDADGNEIAAAVGLKGDVGMAYRALNLDIPGYELTGSEGVETGVFGESQTTVTYSYMSLAEAPAPDAEDEDLPPIVPPVVDEDELPAEEEAPADEDETPVVVPVADDVEESDGPIDDSGEVIVPFDPENPTADLPDAETPATDDTPTSDDDVEESDTPIDDSGEVIVDKDVDENGNPIAGANGDATDEDAKETATEKETEDKAAAVALNDKDGGSGDAKSGEMKAIPQASAETNWFVIAMGALATGGAAFMLYMRRLKPGASQE